MTEDIGSRLIAACEEQDISLYLSEAQEENYPYAVYDADYTPYYDKDGMYKIVGDVIVKAYSKGHVEAETLAARIDAIVLYTFATDGYRVRVVSQLKKECLQETWSVTYQYRIIQYR